jgi:hypothetical protein
VALFALDGLAHLRSRQPDVLTTINASASHGVLLYALRKIVTGLDAENGKFMDSAHCPQRETRNEYAHSNMMEINIFF